MANPNLKLLADAAKLLTPILEESVFVGGCTTALLITDKAAADVRATYDVDAIAEITTYGGYVAFSEKLKKLGFREDTREGAPNCRWRQHTTTLDVMPLDGSFLGFKNAWYEPALASHNHPKGVVPAIVQPSFFQWFTRIPQRALQGGEMAIRAPMASWVLRLGTRLL